MSKPKRKHTDNMQDALDELYDSSSVPALSVEPDAELPEITDLQLRFVDEYMVDLNGQQACLRVGGISEDSARSQASRWLADANVRQHIIVRQNAEIMTNGIKRSDTYKMLLDSIMEINLRMASCDDKEFTGLVNSRLKHIDLLNKMGGFYLPDTQINVLNNINFDRIDVNIISKNAD